LQGFEACFSFLQGMLWASLDGDSLSTIAALQCPASFVHITDKQQLSVMAASLIATLLRTSEVSLLSLMLPQQKLLKQLQQQLSMPQQQEKHSAAAREATPSPAMTQRQGHEYWQQWQQRQQQLPGSVWVPSSLGLLEAQYQALLEQVAMVTEVSAASTRKQR
jgi:hypothetical protein